MLTYETLLDPSSYLGLDLKSNALFVKALRLAAQMEEANDTLTFHAMDVNRGFFSFSNTALLAGLDEKKIGTTGWKAHVSMNPEDLARGWNLIYPLLKAYAISFKVAIIDPNNPRENPNRVAKGQRLYDGMQVTIYLAPGSEQRIQILLNKIESCLQTNRVRPGVIDASDRSLGNFISVRHAGMDKYIAATENRGYNPENVPDPFEQFNPLNCAMPPDYSAVVKSPGAKTFFSRAFKLAGHVAGFKSQPSSFSEIEQNQRHRREAMQSYQGDQDPLSVKDLEAVKRFWSTLTYFCLELFQKNHDALHMVFPDIFPQTKDLSKNQVLTILDDLIIRLQAKEQRCAVFIDIITGDNCAPSSQRSQKASASSESAAAAASADNVASSVSPVLFIRQGDLLHFAREQSEKGLSVLIADAANRQRLGDSAFKKGTFQEAGTRELDAYLKNMALFRNVLADLQRDGQLAVEVSDAEIKRVSVLDHQMDFFQLILVFIRQAILDDQYFASPGYKSDFLAAANNIYGRIQNTVFEVPFFENTAGFVKHLRFVPQTINNTSDLFEGDRLKSDLFEGQERRLLMVEIVAPDRRSLNRVDRACTFHRELQQDGIDEELAKRAVRTSISYMLEEAIRNGVDVILINALGCNAFKNSPEIIAKDMAVVLKGYAPRLLNKTIYFMDLDPKMCEIFDKHFHHELHDEYRLSRYQASTQLSCPSGEIFEGRVMPTKSDKLDISLLTDDTDFSGVSGEKVSAKSPSPEVHKQLDEYRDYDENLKLLSETIVTAGEKYPALTQQALIIQEKIISISKHEPQELNLESIKELNDVMISVVSGLNNPMDQANQAKLTTLSQTITGKTSPLWKSLGIALLVFTGVACILAGVLGAIPTGGIGLLAGISIGLTSLAAAETIALGIKAIHYGHEINLAGPVGFFSSQLKEIKSDKPASEPQDAIQQRQQVRCSSSNVI